VAQQRNPSGRPLADFDWLEAHHRAKLPERRAFCARLAALNPSSVLDLGCATGLWLDELDAILPDGCRFIGVDSDSDALAEAERRASGWTRPARFEQMNLGDPSTAIPDADLTLLFNVSSYIADIDALLDRFAKGPGTLAVRQYDGAALRFGPMATRTRAAIDRALFAGVGVSGEFRHYDLDRLFTAIQLAPFTSRDIDFELFQRSTPFPEDFLDYYAGTLSWTEDHVSEAARAQLSAWRRDHAEDPSQPAYFIEVDLTAVLS
jgi:SAM-dependent methyltransferase